MTSIEREEKKRKLQQELAEIEAEEKADRDRVSVLTKLPKRYRDLFSGSDKWTQDRFDMEAGHLLEAVNNVLPVLANMAHTSSSCPTKKVAKKVAPKSTETGHSTATCFICDNPVCTCSPLEVSEPVNIASHTIHRDNVIRSDVR